MKLRFIHMTIGDLERERISIGDDFKSPAKDFVPPGWKLSSDTVHDVDFPGSFPTNCDFEKVR